MNQILVTKMNKKKSKYFFKIQFIISIVIVIFFVGYLIYNYNNDKNMEYISSVLNKNIEISKIYYPEKINLENNLYLGKIRIKKINLEYPIFSNFNEELLKIAPCRFYGSNIEEKGNICIAGHNYNDERFFSRITELEIKDEIKLIDLNENEYTYIVFDIFETDENDINSVIKKKKEFELTLLTCNNSNKKRIIVKAFRTQK